MARILLHPGTSLREKRDGTGLPARPAEISSPLPGGVLRQAPATALEHSGGKAPAAEADQVRRPCPAAGVRVASDADALREAWRTISGIAAVRSWRVGPVVGGGRAGARARSCDRRRH